MSLPRRIHSSHPVFTDIPAILQDIGQVLTSGRLMLGPYLEQFEQAFAQLVGCRYAIGVSSCTTALEITLRYLGIEGAEVVVPTNTFIATANAVIYAGGTPVLTDISPDTLCLDPVNLRSALSGKTKAVVLVHLAGMMTPDLPQIHAMCQERGIALIEDCAHAHGATFAGVHAGATGLAGCFSFYPTKLMTTGNGGMITTDDERLNDYARSIRLHGRASGGQDPGDQISILGNDWFLDEIRSVVGLHQLRHLSAQLAKRRALVEEYLARLRALPAVKALVPEARCQPSYYKFMVLVDTAYSGLQLKTVLQERHGIDVESLYVPPCHLQPVYRHRFGYRSGMFSVAEAVLPRQLCLPVHPGLTVADVQFVVSCLAAEMTQAETLLDATSR